MSFVLTLVASGKKLTPAHLAGMERFIDSQGLNQIGDPRWLAPGKAAEVPVTSCLNPEQMRALHNALTTDRIDVFCTPAQGRRKKLLVADMDATIVTTETLDELAAHAGIGDKIAAITARAMNGEIDFEGALKERVGLLKGLPADKVKKTLAEVKLSPGADVLVRTMAKNGATCVLVSGGFTVFTGEVARRCGFHHHHGNTLECDDKGLLGTVGTPILGKDAKRTFLDTYTQSLGLKTTESLALGDGANDLPMLSAAGLGIGYRPKPVLKESVRNCIFYGDLTAVLYAQGYKQPDFAAAS